MKYVLDIILVLGLAVIGYLWNEERQAGLACGDEVSRLQAQVDQLEKNLGQAREESAAAASEVEAIRAQLAQAEKDLLEKSDAYLAKEAELGELKEVATALKNRVDELQGYKDRAQQAIIAEMPKPIVPAVPAANPPPAAPAVP